MHRVERARCPRRLASTELAPPCIQTCRAGSALAWCGAQGSSHGTRTSAPPQRPGRHHCQPSSPPTLGVPFGTVGVAQQNLQTTPPAAAAAFRLGSSVARLLWQLWSLRRHPGHCGHCSIGVSLPLRNRGNSRNNPRRTRCFAAAVRAEHS